MSGNIIQLNERFIQNELKTLVKKVLRKLLTPFWMQKLTNWCKLSVTHATRLVKATWIAISIEQEKICAKL